MAIFRYEAADVNGKVLRGAMEAASAQEVTQQLARRGYRALTVQGAPAPAASRPATTTRADQTSAAAGTAAAARPTASVPATEVAAVGWALRPGVRPEALGIFFRQLTALLHAGFTPGAALADLGGRTADGRLAAAARKVAAAISGGASFAAEMARHPDVFPAHVIGLVEAGELGGFLPFACEEAALGAEQDAALRQGLWLPQILVWQSVWTVLLMVPLFPRIFLEGVGAYLRAVLLWSVPMGIGLHVLAALVAWLGRQPALAPGRDRLLLTLPLARRLAQTRALAAFTRVLRRLLKSGISPEPAFVSAARSVPNRVLRERLMAGAPVVRAGQGIDAAIAATGLMQHDPLQMLVTGQRSGQWVEMLEQVTAYYQEEAARATDAVRGAQKRASVLITIIVSGYVFIAASHGVMSSTMQWVDEFFKQ